MGEINFFPDDLEIKDQKIILRLDLNVPIKDKVIKDDTRITLCLPFINRLIEKKAKIIIISHLGRPKGINVSDLSLIPVYKYLKDALKTNVYFFRATLCWFALSNLTIFLYLQVLIVDIIDDRFYLIFL